MHKESKECKSKASKFQMSFHELQSLQKYSKKMSDLQENEPGSITKLTAKIEENILI